MSRFLTVPLVLLLSGAPAATIVCDLVLCTAPANPPATSTGCHDHATTPSGARMTAGRDDCSHISSPGPYLTSAVRGLLQPLVMPSLGPPIRQGPISSLDRLQLTTAHGPPGSLRLQASLPLRI